MSAVRTAKLNKLIKLTSSFVVQHKGFKIEKESSNCSLSLMVAGDGLTTLILCGGLYQTKPKLAEGARFGFFILNFHAQASLALIQNKKNLSAKLKGFLW